jgi:Holliday junction DNA helicase RuvA
MIGRLTGILLEKNPPQILLDVQGVAYELDVPMSTFYNLPVLHEKVVLHTQLIVREDAHLLYGFLSHEERVAFRQLLKISGVGPKLALSVLSGLSLNDLAVAVANKEAGRLTVNSWRRQEDRRAAAAGIAGQFAATGTNAAHAVRQPHRPATISPMRCWLWLQRQGSRLGSQTIAQRCQRLGRYSSGA